LVEEFPDLEYVLKVLPGHLVEMTFESAELLLVLLFKHLKVKV
jgi:hypothetical protein